MARYQNDPVDFACEAWAFQWVNQFVRLPVKASDQLGRIGSTLDLIKLMGDGAGSSGWVTQLFPEVFFGDALVIACLIKSMRERDRNMLWWHYVDRWYFARVVAVKTADGRQVFHHTTTAERIHPYSHCAETIRVVDRTRPDTQVLIERRDRPIKAQTMALKLGISRAEYHVRRDRMKAYVRGLLDAHKCLDTKVGYGEAVPV